MASFNEGSSWRESAADVAEFLGLDAECARALASKMVALGYLEKSFGRAIVRPTADGLALVASALAARAAGMSLHRSIAFAVSADRAAIFGSASLREPAVIGGALGQCSFAITLPEGLGGFLLGLETKGRSL